MFARRVALSVRAESNRAPLSSLCSGGGLGDLVCFAFSALNLVNNLSLARSGCACVGAKKNPTTRYNTHALYELCLWIADPYLQKMELQRTAIDCLSTVISLAGPETAGMLLAHRVPAILCVCIRRYSCPTPPPGAVTPTRGDTACSAPSYRQRRFALVHPAVCALARLVHPTGAQWAPIRTMPFHEATARRRLGLKIPVAVASGLAVGAKAAAELGASVWQQTAKHLLEVDGCEGSSGSDEEGAVSLAAAMSAESGRGRRGIGEADNSAIDVLCRVLCDAGDLSCGSETSRGPEGVSTPPTVDHSVGSRDCSGASQRVQIAALRVLLHACRASFGVAHAVATFDGGATVQALLDRLCSPAPAKGAAANVSVRRPPVLKRREQQQRYLGPPSLEIEKCIKITFLLRADVGEQCNVCTVLHAVITVSPHLHVSRPSQKYKLTNTPP